MILHLKIHDNISINNDDDSDDDAIATNIDKNNGNYTPPHPYLGIEPQK